jgi:ketosteroid isomerase-like protein
VAEDFVKRLGAGIDTMDAEIFAGFFRDDASFRFGNGPLMSGRNAIRDGVAQFFTMIRAIKHTPLRVHRAGDFVIAEMDCDYVDQWGRSLKVPVCNVLTMQGDKISEYFIYIDNHALFVPPAV